MKMMQADLSKALLSASSIVITLETKIQFFLVHSPLLYLVLVKSVRHLSK